MKIEPFRPLLAALFTAVIGGGAPAMADGQPTGTGSSAAAAKPKVIPSQPKPTGQPSTTLNGLHLKLGNVELKVRGPVILDAGPTKKGDTSTNGH